MVGYAGTFQPTTPFPGSVRRRALICLLAATLALVNIDVIQHAAPSGARGNYSTIIAVGGTRIRLACEGYGPATVAIIDPSGLRTAINDAVQAQLARSVRLCTIELAEAASRSTPNLPRLLPATLYAERVPAPFVIVTYASALPAFSQAHGSTPFIELVAGWVLITPLPMPPTGVVIRADGATWSLPIGDGDETALSIMSLFWPPEEA